MKTLSYSTYITLQTDVKQLTGSKGGYIKAVDLLKSAVTLHYDYSTYVCRPFKKGETVKVIMPMDSVFNEHPARPMIIADTDFPDDIFVDCAPGDLLNFREGGNELQRAVVNRNVAALHRPDTEETWYVPFVCSPGKYRDYYELTKGSFTTVEQQQIETLLGSLSSSGSLSLSNKSRAFEKLDILLNTAPNCGTVMPSPEEMRRVLDLRISGLDDIKDALIRSFTVSGMSGKKGKVICLVGPAGTGKSTLAREVANAAHKPFA